MAKLYSMTGFGRAVNEADGLRVSSELKSVNGRGLKLSIKAPSSLAARESLLESKLRERLNRGTVTLVLRVQLTDPSAVVAIDEQVVRAYQDVFRRLNLAEDRIPLMPGVIAQNGNDSLGDAEWTTVCETVNAALDDLVAMRSREGEAMSGVVCGLLDNVASLRDSIAERAPAVVLEYQQKLRERIEQLLEGEDRVRLEPEHLAREVALFADRCDVTEEIDRLHAHVTQARELIAKGGDIGRTLEFVAQEMHREVNTIGSKSSDAQLSKLVIRLKSEVAKIKEQVANIE